MPTLSLDGVELGAVDIRAQTPGRLPPHGQRGPDEFRLFFASEKPDLHGVERLVLQWDDGRSVPLTVIGTYAKEGGQLVLAKEDLTPDAPPVAVYEGHVPRPPPSPKPPAAVKPELFRAGDVLYSRKDGSVTKVLKVQPLPPLSSTFHVQMYPGTFPSPEAATEALRSGALRPHLSAPVDAASFTADDYVVIAHLAEARR